MLPYNNAALAIANLIGVYSYLANGCKLCIMKQESQ